MTIKETAIKGTLVLSAGRMIERALQLLRNIIVARLVSPEDFGIAALFVMTVSFLEMFSNLAVDTLLTFPANLTTDDGGSGVGDSPATFTFRRAGGQAL